MCFGSTLVASAPNQKHCGTAADFSARELAEVFTVLFFLKIWAKLYYGILVLHAKQMEKIIVLKTLFKPQAWKWVDWSSNCTFKCVIYRNTHGMSTDLIFISGDRAITQACFFFFFFHIPYFHILLTERWDDFGYAAVCEIPWQAHRQQRPAALTSSVMAWAPPGRLPPTRLRRTSAEPTTHRIKARGRVSRDRAEWYCQPLLPHHH